MGWSGWPMTVIIIAISLTLSYVLIQFGIFFFFLPIIFLPLLKFINKKPPFSPTDFSCQNCGFQSYGKFCPQCGAKLPS